MKAQIVRIDFCTEIVTSNKYRVNKDNEEEQGFQEIEKIEGDDFKEIKFDDLSNLSNWVHMPAAILKQGMTKHLEIENEDEELKKKLTAELLSEDPYEPRLKPISQDKCSFSVNKARVYQAAGS